MREQIITKNKRDRPRACQIQKESKVEREGGERNKRERELATQRGKQERGGEREGETEEERVEGRLGEEAIEQQMKMRKLLLECDQMGSKQAYRGYLDKARRLCHFCLIYEVEAW